MLQVNLIQESVASLAEKKHKLWALFSSCDSSSFLSRFQQWSPQAVLSSEKFREHYLSPTIVMLIVDKNPLTNAKFTIYVYSQLFYQTVANEVPPNHIWAP